MPRVAARPVLNQPDNPVFDDLRDLTSVYEVQVSELLRRVACENSELRRQLAACQAPTASADASLHEHFDSPTKLSGAAPLVVPPSPVAPKRPLAAGDDCGGEPGAPSPPAIGQSEEAHALYFSTNETDSPSPEEHKQAEPATPAKWKDLRKLRWSISSTSEVMFRTSSAGSSSSKNLTPLQRLSRRFEPFVVFAIILNCLSIGIEAHQQGTGRVDPVVIEGIAIMEHFFVLIFTVELLLKLRAYGWTIFKPVDSNGRANFVDMLLVIFTGILFTWIIPLFVLILDFDGQTQELKTLALLRTIRLARLIRVVQKVPLFREAWMLIRGLGDSSRTLGWTCVVVFMVTYIFAIFGLSVIVTELLSQRKDMTDPQEIAEIDELMLLMGGLDRLMATLVQVLTGDSFHAFTRLVNKFIWWAWIYFYAYIAVAVVVLMNLVTAIIVENAMETSRADNEHMVNEQEAKRNKDLEKLRRLFTSMDTDGGGTLSWQELTDSFEDPDLNIIWKLLDFGPQDAAELFYLLDDGDGEITIDEFVEALRRMSGAAQAKDLFRVHKAIGKIETKLSNLASK